MMKWFSYRRSLELLQRLQHPPFSSTSWRSDLGRVRALFDVVRNPLASPAPEDQKVGERVAAEPVGSRYSPPAALAGREEPGYVGDQVSGSTLIPPIV